MASSWALTLRPQDGQTARIGTVASENIETGDSLRSTLVGYGESFLHCENIRNHPYLQLSHSFVAMAASIISAW